MKIAIVSDGAFGERAFGNIRQQLKARNAARR